MATAPTSPQTKQAEVEHDTQQSVYIADQDKVKLYPRSMSNDEIDFDLHTSVRKQTPEDYFVNFKPMTAIQQGFKEIVQGPLNSTVEAGARIGEEGYKKAAKYQDEIIVPALKLGASRTILSSDKIRLAPDENTNPANLANAYKPWLDLWRESVIGKKATGVSDAFLVNAPAPIAAIPWFVAEFAPTELLDFASKPMNWVGAYGYEKFGPPIINKLIQSKFNKEGTAFFSKLFKGEKDLKWAHDIIGSKINDKTSTVRDLYKNAAKWAHEDVGGSKTAMQNLNKAYEAIMKSRSGFMESFYDMFRNSPFSKPQVKTAGLLGNQKGSALIPFSEGDLVKMGKDIGQVVKISGEIAAVNIAGKVAEFPLDKLTAVSKGSNRQVEFEGLLNPKDLTSPESKKEAGFIYKNLDQFDQAYEAQSKKEYGTDNPNIISADVARTAPMEGRGKLTNQGAAERHAGSSAYSKLRYKEKLADPALADKNVMLMAGVSGAGKTGAVRALAGEALEGDIVYDTNVASFESGKRIIEQALTSNPDRNVQIFYVDRDPVKAFEEGVIPRFLDPKGDKRVLPIPAHLNNMKSRDAIQKLFDHYKENPRVSFALIGNYGKRGEYTNINIEDLSKKVYNSEEIGKKLEKGIQDKLNAGTLDKEAADAFLGGKKPSVQGTVRKTEKNTDQSAVNASKLEISPEAKQKLREATETIKDKIENQTGKTLSHDEVIAKATEADILTKGVSREATLDFQASLLKTRQHLAALAEEDKLTPEFLDTLRVMSNLGTDIARNLESLKIQAMPEYATAKIKVISDLIKLGHTSEDIINAADGVNFTDEKSVATFYRQFVKPTLPEILDEFVYMNILSSPATHIVNTFSNIIQLAGLNPLTKLASGAIDAVASNLIGTERTHYLKEVPEFYKGALNAFPEALGNAGEIMKGNKTVDRPDLKHLPTLSPVVDWATLKIGKYFIRALEASDVLFRTMIESGEIQALSKTLGHEPSGKELSEIKKKATERANYYVFRNKPDSTNASGQGDVLSSIDSMTNAIYGLRKVPGMKWFIRFVQTPMNIVKQGVEYSPAGLATLKGADDKSEQAGKAAIGSIVFAGAAYLAANNLTTWSSPTSAEDKNDFYAAGLQPYSIRMGDNWVSYSKLGPLAYPIAMSAALHYFTKESPNALSDSEMDKVVDGLTGIMKFFSDQSYMQGLGDLVKFVSGEKSKAVSSVPSQLVPLSSLQGWVNNIIDPIQRKAEKGLSIESVLDQIQMKIVGMSKFVPPQIDDEEVPVKKQMQAVNSISPVRVSKVNPGKLSEYRESQQDKQLENKDRKEMS